jgi:chaperonin GroEL
LSFNEDCSNKLFAGVTKLADAVKVTLGPGGRLVAFEKNGDFVSTKDGVTAAGAVMPLEDPEENAGAKLVYGAASKTNTVAGDSTTTSTVLAYSIIKEGLKSIAAGYKPTEIKKGIEINHEFG